MSNLIQIKRSNTTSIPTSLANGEMAYTSNGETLYIGSNGAVTAIGGKRVPGVLTANQALVANSTSAIDKIIVANLQPTGIYANGSLGTAGQVLSSNATGVYWSAPSTSVSGSNTQVQYNNSGSLGASAGLVFDFAANNLNIANTVNAASHTVGSNFIANSTALVHTGYANVTTSVNSALLTVGTNFIANSTALVHTGYANVTTSVNSAALTVGTAFIANSTGAYHTGGVNAASHTVGSNFIANSTALVHTGYANVTTSVNSAALTVGSNFIANSTGAYHTGTVNAASHTVGTTFTANATLVNAAAINITGQVNTATLYATTSANVGGNVQITVSQYGITGNSTTAPTMSLTTSSLTIGNSTVTGAPQINVANTLGNTIISTNSIKLSNTVSNVGIFVSGNGPAGAGPGISLLSNSSLTPFLTMGSTTSNVQIISSGQGGGGTLIYMQQSAADAGLAYNTASQLTSYGFTFSNSTANAIDMSSAIAGQQYIALGANSTANAFVVNVAGTYVLGTINAASHTVGSNFIANSTAIVGTGYANVTTSVNSALLTVGTSFIANSTGAYHTGTVNAASHTVGTTFTANATLVNAAAINITGQVNTATLYATTSANVGGNVQITVSQYGITGNSTTAPTMSLTGSALTVGNSTITGAPTINLANSTGNTTVNVTSIGTSWGLNSNSSGIYHSGVINAASHTVGSNFIANSTAIVGTGYANITTSVNSALFTVGTTFTANATLVNAAALNVVNQVNTATFYATTSANVGTAFTANASLVNAIALNVVNTTNTQYLNVSKDVSIAGNLSVTGSLVTINVSNISTTDPLIRLASNNTSTADNIDIGIYGNYTNTTSSYYTALYRDNASKYWKLLDNITSEPTTTITGGSQAALQAYLNSGGLVSNSTAVTLTANSTVAVNFTANSLSLSSALSGTNGGTGLSSYTSEDILVANSSNGFRKLSVGSEGYVLQVASGVVTYGTLDGGTF